MERIKGLKLSTRTHTLSLNINWEMVLIVFECILHVHFKDVINTFSILLVSYHFAFCISRKKDTKILIIYETFTYMTYKIGLKRSPPDNSNPC